ncbi:isopentenyl-diphosphate delta-isomerase [Actinoalloteichus hoggarensis]|uniref:Isopentenyl-diphosphate Delta-isomerase n=1 Tax=Actinoalloteichus hoggarensis TaxID=1470176 RepID=A0A221W082_9PSEU|nr:isopentenyl-diphosphate Delta-isomerase [Actinoalloteichus hoggarensis]ASO19176.1 Isopentenyl-diphosphate Delta-isomerase [Actinoalloteichus hoggarensis]MBB5920412.1 isopentenyl-diphosphate delta-isomerase [Actinoalloteichus hoggarensis]
MTVTPREQQRSREERLVELVDEQGRTVGRSSVHDAHSDGGILHRAFSVMLIDDRDRVLLQQRSSAKLRFPTRWTNTCCGHPWPGEPVATAARARLREELGVEVAELSDAGAFVYRAPDAEQGYVEHEYDHVLIGRFEGEPGAVDPSEVRALRWEPLTEVLAAVAEGGREDFTPWFPQVAGATRAFIARR